MTQASLLKQLRKDFPSLQFSVHEDNYWSPDDRTVYYAPQQDESALWALLHETSHGLLKHTQYKSDFDLILLELTAWERAQQLSKKYAIAIDEDHIQDCVDSYRDWQHARSLCPDCSLGGLQINPHTYQCLFCYAEWTVSTARFCRAYRKRKFPSA